MKINENQGFWALRGYPGWPAAGRRGGLGGAREVVVSVRGVAAGVPEARNTFGVMLAVSPPICMVFGGL